MIFAIIDKKSDFTATFEEGKNSSLVVTLPSGQILTFGEKDNHAGFDKFLDRITKEFITLKGDI